MSQFEYITVFVSIVVAIAVAELLAGLGRLIRERAHVKIYWIHVAWMILAILAQSNSWWAIWNIRTHEFESYVEFMALVVPSLMFVIIAFLLSPPIDSERPFDLRAYYFHQIRWVAPLFVVQFTCLAFFQSALGFEQNASLIAIRVAVGAAILTLAFSANEKLHRAVVLTVYALFILSVAVVR